MKRRRLLKREDWFENSVRYVVGFSRIITNITYSDFFILVSNMHVNKITISVSYFTTCRLIVVYPTSSTSSVSKSRGKPSHILTDDHRSCSFCKCLCESSVDHFCRKFVTDGWFQGRRNARGAQDEWPTIFHSPRRDDSRVSNLLHSL